MHATAADQFALDRETGEHLTATLTEHLGRIEQWMERTRALARPLPLGANPVGTAMSEKFSRRADGGEGSFTAALDEYRVAVRRARDRARGACR